MKKIRYDNDSPIYEGDEIIRVSTGEEAIANDEWNGEVHDDWKKVIRTPTFFVSLEYSNTGYVDSLGEFVGEKTQKNTIAQISQRTDLLRYLEDCGEIKFFLWDNKEEMEQAADDGHDCYDCDFSGTWEELISPYVAKLVTCSLMTRVIVSKGATEEQIIEAARAKFSEKLENELSENIEKIIDDDVCPFDPETDSITIKI